MSLLDENLDYFPTMKEQGLLCTVVYHIPDRQDKTILDEVVDPVLKEPILQSVNPRYEGIGAYQFYTQIELYISEQLNKLHTIDLETDIRKELLNMWPSLHIEYHEEGEQTFVIACKRRDNTVMTVIISKFISA